MQKEEVRHLRKSLGLTQQQLAERLGVSFATLNRWENGQVVPSALGLERLRTLVRGTSDTGLAPTNAIPIGPKAEPTGTIRLDFLGDPRAVRVLVEAERLTYGHLFNPAFAAEISQIDPLPHQRIAVYDRMLTQSRLRFLLADDAGAGKTIMTGLYVRESLSRRTIRRVLIVAPAGLIGNWRRELQTLFQLRFRIVTGADAREGNPFAGAEGDLIIVSLDSLRQPNLFNCLRETSAAPYDLVVFDEAHKLSASRDPDGTFRATDRYRLAESLAGVCGIDESWRLPWTVHHLLLLTATPHMGKAFPYYCLWRLLEPELFSTETAFNLFPKEARHRYFIRRVKEEMVDLSGKPLYPERVCDTVSYDLTQGNISEQRLYDETTAYIRHYYNQARLLNRQAARFAMTVFQRRLASSTWAMLCSFRNRLERLEKLIDDIRSGRVPEDELRLRQQRLDREVRDSLADKTADEEQVESGREEHEVDEAKALGAFVATSLAELQVERQKVEELVRLAQSVHGAGHESKFERMSKLLRDTKFAGHKVIIYTEHRDTLDFLARRLEGLGYAGQIAFIHGGLDFKARDEQVERFRRSHDQGGDGARFFIGTDAAAEGINLQFCWVLINYDIPWNPARLEQRMGRIHRYGQRRDRVAIMNLVAGKTREGRVVKTLLEKLEEIREQLGSDKVFDVIGRVFEGLSLTDYIQRAVESDDVADEEAMRLAGQLTPEQVRAIADREKAIYEKGGDVAAELPRLRSALELEQLRRLLPGYVRRFLEAAAPLLGFDLIGDLDCNFLLRATHHDALEPIIPLLEAYPAATRNQFTVHRPADKRDAIFLHPGEPVFDRLCAVAIQKCQHAGQRGAIFVDVSASAPYLLHVARVSVVRGIDPGYPSFHSPELLEQRLVGLQQFADGRLEAVPVEHLLLLKPTTGAAPTSVPFVAQGDAHRQVAIEHVKESVLKQLAQTRQLVASERLKDTEEYLKRAYDYQDAELASTRRRYTERARDGDGDAALELERTKTQQRSLAQRRNLSIAEARREVELIQPGEAEIFATALVQPSQNPEDIKARDAAVEQIAMELAVAYEASRGAEVKDVSTRDKARLARLNDYPGFDLLSKHATGERGIEVKGRISTGEIELTENEWAQACNLRERYWLYVVFDCGSAAPRLVRVQDPFRRLVAKARGSVVIAYSDIVQCAAA